MKLMPRRTFLQTLGVATAAASLALNAIVLGEPARPRRVTAVAELKVGDTVAVHLPDGVTHRHLEEFLVTENEEAVFLCSVVGDPYARAGITQVLLDTFPVVLVARA